MADPDSDPAATVDGVRLASDGGLHPDHPLLARAQEALKRQLLANKMRIEGELREKENALKMAKSKRENVGVELYGFQQGLAKLQMQLETTHQNYQAINSLRLQAEAQLAEMRSRVDEDSTTTKIERSRVEKHQLELDRLGATLKQVETYNEQMKGEVAVTRRAAYAAEGAVQQLERQKLEQDLRINGMQESVKSLQQQLILHTAQHEAQKRETRAAMETLAEAEGEMESVQFEKKQLVAQWKSSINAIQKRDEALSAIQSSLKEQQEHERSMDAEFAGYKRDIIKQQVQNEQLTSVLKKVEGESLFVGKQIEGMMERQERLQEMYSKLAKSLEHTEKQVSRTVADHKALTGEQEAVDRAITKVFVEIGAVEDEMMAALSDQTTADKSGSKTGKDIRDLRKKVRDEELLAVEGQNELAKLQVDILNTEAHNVKLGETLKLLDEELSEKAASIEKYDLEIKRRNDDIEKKTREIDMLNRKLERIVGSAVEEDSTGPLEALIRNIQREMDTKGLESKELQRRWIGYQNELVQLQGENQQQAEGVARMRAENTILFQKKRRLEGQLETQQKEMKALQAGMVRLGVDLQRINGLIAQNSSAREALKEDNLNLESRIMNDLRILEEEAAHLNALIEVGRATKQDTLAEVVEVERQIMLWERKILLEKEMQDVLDPTIGQDVVGEMRKEIHRMELRHGELMKLQEKLIVDLEKALNKREVVGIKGRANQMRSKGQKDASLTRTQLDKAVTDLQRSIRETEQEAAATDQRVRELHGRKAEVERHLSQLDASAASAREKEQQLADEVGAATRDKYRLLLGTARAQKRAKRLEDMIAGKYKPLVEDPSKMDQEMDKVKDKLNRVIALIEEFKMEAPELSNELDKILCHAPPPIQA